MISVSKGQRATCKFDPQLAGGDYILEIASVLTDASATPTQMQFTAVLEGTKLTLEKHPSATDPASGLYPNARIRLTMVNNTGGEPVTMNLHIPINLVVTE